MEINWDERYSVKIKSIDDQHRMFFQYFEKAYKMYKAGNVSAGLDELVREMFSYIDMHFEYEEKLFKKHGYPNAKHHIKMHDEIRDRLTVYRKNLKEGRPVPMIEFLGFMVNWIREHIDREDRTYVEFFHGRGVE